MLRLLRLTGLSCKAPFVLGIEVNRSTLHLGDFVDLF